MNAPIALQAKMSARNVNAGLSDETALRYLVQADEAQRAGLSSAQSNGPLPLNYSMKARFQPQRGDMFIGWACKSAIAP